MIVHALKHSFTINLKSSPFASKGNVLNLIQVDCESLEQYADKVYPACMTTLLLIVASILGVYFMGFAFITYLVITSVFLWVMYKQYEKNLKNELECLKEKDKRMSFLSNLLTNIRFIKYNVLENFYAKMAYELRRKELNW